MGGGKGGGGGEAARARADEMARQMKVRQGTSRINSIFDGTYTPGGRQIGLGEAGAGQTYYTADGKKLEIGAGETAMDAYARRALLDFGGDPNDAAQLATTRQNVSALNPTLFTEGTQTGGFGDKFFADQRQRYIDYATPQLDDQYKDANKELTFALSRSGLLDSSARGQKASELQKLYDTNRQKVVDDALSYETQSRNAVEDARSNLITTLNATGDAEGAANAALARSTALSQAPAYSPLTQLFGDFTSGLGVQAAQERSQAAGGPAARYSTGLFGSKKNAVKVS